MITNIAWKADDRLLQKSNLTVRQPRRAPVTLYISLTNVVCKWLCECITDSMFASSRQGPMRITRCELQSSRVTSTGWPLPFHTSSVSTGQYQPTKNTMQNSTIQYDITDFTMLCTTVLYTTIARIQCETMQWNTMWSNTMQQNIELNWIEFILEWKKPYYNYAIFSYILT